MRAATGLFGALLAVVLAATLAPASATADGPDLSDALGPREGDAQTPRGSMALRVLDVLQAANDARLEAGRLRREAATARLELEAEAARMDLETARIEAETRRLREQAARWRAEQGPLRQEAEALDALEAQVEDRVHLALDRLARTVPPGVVPERSDGGGVDGALDRLAAAERRLRQIEVQVLEGRLEQGAPLAAQVLRVGGAAAWWLALDGSRGGWAVMDEGSLVFEPGPADLVGQVARALAMAKGQSTVLPIGLPLAPSAAPPSLEAEIP